ncbi:MAG: hypothetical protein IH910_03370 [Proteobacteria bacterium]|nr:hypothetical protein [Pseudomonadota bacterium]
MTAENDVPNDVQTDNVKKEAAKVEDDNVGDISVEINVEELVAKIEASDTEDAEKARIRKQLDKLREQQDSELNTTYNFDLDDDL